MFALKPLGGSFVTFTEFWSTETGNALEGIELSQSLKSGWISEGSSAIFKMILSIASIQDVAK